MRSLNTFALMNIIKMSEKDIEDGRVRKAEDVFKDLREKINNPVQAAGVCCSGKVLDSGFNTRITQQAAGY
jgi:hypothetical protein